MKPESRILFLQMLDAGTTLEKATSELSYAQFLADQLRRGGVDYAFIVIGEALMKLSKTEPELVEDLPKARDAIGFRNVLVHGYATVSDARVWEILLEDLPPFVAAVRHRLGLP